MFDALVVIGFGLLAVCSFFALVMLASFDEREDCR
jgi:hypothetical protein